MVSESVVDRCLFLLLLLLIFPLAYICTQNYILKKIYIYLCDNSSGHYCKVMKCLKGVECFLEIYQQSTYMRKKFTYLMKHEYSTSYNKNGFYFIINPTLFFILNLFHSVDLIFLSILRPIYKVQMSILMEIVIFKNLLYRGTGVSL